MLCTLRCGCLPNRTPLCPFIRWDPLPQLKKKQAELRPLLSRTSTRSGPLTAETASAEASPSNFPFSQFLFFVHWSNQKSCPDLPPPLPTFLCAGCPSTAARTAVHRTSSSCPRKWPRTGSPWRSAWTARSSSRKSSPPASAACAWPARGPASIGKRSPSTCHRPTPSTSCHRNAPSTRYRERHRSAIRAKDLVLLLVQG